MKPKKRRGPDFYAKAVWEAVEPAMKKLITDYERQADVRVKVLVEQGISQFLLRRGRCPTCGQKVNSDIR